MKGSVVSNMMSEGLRSSLETQQYSILKLAVIALNKENLFEYTFDDISPTYFLKLENPFLLRNALCFLSALEYAPNEVVKYRTLFLTSYIEALEDNKFSLPSFTKPNVKHPYSKLRRHSSFYLLHHFPNAYLREEELSQVCLNPNPNEIIDLLDCALDLCSRNRQIFSQLLSDIKWFIPISTPSKRVHCSFTVPSLPGVIFLSCQSIPMRLAEAIVHEHGHMQLNVLLEQDDVVIDEGKLFYSPWKDEPRPVHGLLHALYVFAEVGKFLFLLLQEGIDAETQWLTGQLRVITSRLHIGFLQLEKCQFTNVGLTVRDDIFSCLSELKKNGFLTDIYFSELRSHFETWHLKHCEETFSTEAFNTLFPVLKAY